MPSKTREEAEQWLLADEEPMGTLAWHAPVRVQPSAALARAARALVSHGLPVALLPRVERVAAALAELEAFESQEQKSSRRRNG